MTTRTKTNQDEIDALLAKIPDPDTRKAQVAVDLGLFGFAYGRDALDEVYRRASEWMDREEMGFREQHEAPAPIEQWGRGND